MNLQGRILQLIGKNRFDGDVDGDSALQPCTSVGKHGEPTFSSRNRTIIAQGLYTRQREMTRNQKYYEECLVGNSPEAYTQLAKLRARRQICQPRFSEMTGFTTILPGEYWVGLRREWVIGGESLR